MTTIPANDPDALVYQDAVAAVSEIDLRYRRADVATQIALRDERDRAFAALTAARISLLKPGIITTPQDVQEMRDLRQQVNQAAVTQDLVIAAGRVVGFLLRLAA